MGRKKTKNNYYAYITETERGIVDSWPACEQKVKGRKARYQGFVDRASAERWLAGDLTPSAGRPLKFYAYHTETEDGVVDSWERCERKVEGRKARYRSFPDRESAQRWLEAGAKYEDRQAGKEAALEEFPEDAVFFDAGTGAGRGVEVKVTDRGGVPMAHLAGPRPDGATLTEEGNLLLGHSRTNNFGELLGCLLAIRAAERLGSSHVYGDSKLVIDYWSKGLISRNKREADPDLSALVRETSAARKNFERSGGRVAHISGGLNPADLGFHRD